MLDGKRPSECGYCWKVEDNSDSFSDRIFKSEEPWSINHLSEIKNLIGRDDYLPKYVEVSFSNTCNFKVWILWSILFFKVGGRNEKHGEFSTNTIRLKHLKRDTLPFKKSEYNPYVEAFWKWCLNFMKDMDTFRITGGEPLLSKDTFKVLDDIITTDSPNKNPNLSINSTNMCR